MRKSRIDLIVAPRRGRPVEPPWWRTAPNACRHESNLYDGMSQLGLRETIVTGTER